MVKVNAQILKNRGQISRKRGHVSTFNIGEGAVDGEGECTDSEK